MTSQTSRVLLLLAVVSGAAACKEPFLNSVDPVAAPTTGCEPAAAATGLTATVSASQIDLSWESGASGDFQIRVEMDHGVGFAEVARLAASARTWSDVGAACTQPNTWCDYRVQAFTASCDTPPSPALRVHSVPAAPGTPTAATSADGQVITVGWADANDWETGYRVERAPRGTTAFTLLQTLAANATSYEDAAPPVDSGFTYRITALMTVEGGVTLSSDSVTVDGFTPPNPPSGLTATPVSVGRIDLAWTDPNAQE